MLKPCKRKRYRGTYFPNCHAHTGLGSLGDAFGGVELWIQAIKKRGIKHHFVTDHGVLTAIPWMYDEGKKNDIVIHPGMEGYVIPELDGYRDKEGKVVRHRFRHIVLLPINDIGWKNLIKINNMSWREGRFRGRGRFTYDMLFKNSEGLICTTACMGGIFAAPYTDYYIGRNTYPPNEKEVFKLVSKFKEVFNDNLYIEFMINHYEQQKQVNSHLLKIMKHFKIEPLITNDCHYPEPEHIKYREAIREFKYRSATTDVSRETDTDNEGKETEIPDLYLRSVEEIRYVWEKLGYADVLPWGVVSKGIDNASVIAETCKFQLDTSLKLPTFDVKKHPLYNESKAHNKEELFIYLIKCGYEKKLKRTLPETRWDKFNAANEDPYFKRICEEYKVIKEAGFIDYFLIVEDIIRYCTDILHRLYGRGRGSVAGSVISWCLDITRDDPIKYGLFFERFMNPGRVKGELPDIDMDFPSGARDKIKAYIVKKYGEENVTSIGNIGMIKIKSAIQKMASVQDFTIDGTIYDFHTIQQITHKVPTSIGGGVMIETLEDAVSVCSKNPENLFYKFYLKHTKWLEKQVKVVLDHPINYGKHAAGIVISDRPIDTCIPIRIENVGGQDLAVSQWRDKDLLPQGFLKLDILGLKTLDQIEYAWKLMKKKSGITPPDIHEIDRNDKKVLNMIKDGKTMGVFQLNSRLFQTFFKELKPSKFKHIYTTTALLRPGPLKINSHQKYIEIEHGVKEPEYLHPLMKHALESTGGIAIFQEQVMQLAVDMAGYTLEEADNLRSIVGKKKRDKIGAEKQKFINGCIKNKISQKIAEQVFFQIEGWAGYGFNKSIFLREEVRMSDNSSREIINVSIGDWVKSRDEQTKQRIDVKVVDKYKHEAELFEFVFDDGKTIKCSMEHKYRTTDGRILPMWQIIKGDLDVETD